MQIYRKNQTFLWIYSSSSERASVGIEALSQLKTLEQNGCFETGHQNWRFMKCKSTKLDLKQTNILHYFLRSLDKHVLS